MTETFEKLGYPLTTTYTTISSIRCKPTTTTHPYLYCYKRVYIDSVTVFTFVLVFLLLLDEVFFFFRGVFRVADLSEHLFHAANTHTHTRHDQEGERERERKIIIIKITQ
jgi:hypothetical protein